MPFRDLRARQIGERSPRVEMHDLAARVHTRVGAPGSANSEKTAVLARELAQRPLDLSLYRRVPRLVLESEVSLPVVRHLEHVGDVSPARLAMQSAFIAQRCFQRRVAPIPFRIHGVQLTIGGVGGRGGRSRNPKRAATRSRRCRPGAGREPRKAERRAQHPEHAFTLSALGL